MSIQDICSDINPIINILKAVLKIVQWAIPIILIFLGTFDIMKAVIASKEDEIKAAQKLLIKRVIYAVVIFLIPVMIRLVFNVVAKQGTDGTADLFKCWDQAQANTGEEQKEQEKQNSNQTTEKQ